MTNKLKTVFITGGNRGIGLELCKKFSEHHWKVYMGARDIAKARQAIALLDHKDAIIPIQIDVSDENSVKQAFLSYQQLKNENEILDVFINNAGVNLDWHADNDTYCKSLESSADMLETIYKTNVFASIFTLKHFLPAMGKGTRVVNVASGAGEFWDANANKDFQIGYAPSKSALIMTTKKLAAAVKDKGIYVNAVCPDWCQTDMGGHNAAYTAEQGALSVIKACFLTVSTPPTGCYFRHGKRIPLDVKPYSLEFFKIIWHDYLLGRFFAKKSMWG